MRFVEDGRGAPGQENDHRVERNVGRILAGRNQPVRDTGTSGGDARRKSDGDGRPDKGGDDGVSHALWLSICRATDLAHRNGTPRRSLAALRDSMNPAKKTGVISWTRVAHSRSMMCHLDRQVRRSGDDVVGAPVSRWLGDSAAARKDQPRESPSPGRFCRTARCAAEPIKVAVAVNVEGQGTGGDFGWLLDSYKEVSAAPKGGMARRLGRGEARVRGRRLLSSMRSLSMMLSAGGATSADRASTHPYPSRLDNDDCTVEVLVRNDGQTCPSSRISTASYPAARNAGAKDRGRSSSTRSRSIYPTARTCSAAKTLAA
jgi:hypothetical protein